MVALEAGCVQKPHVGTRIGLDGSVLSTTPVNITYPGDTGDPRHKKGLSQGGIIGISVTAGVFLLIAAAALFICFRKHVDRKRIKGLQSPLDARFGANNITTPSNGAYGNPYASPPIIVSQPYDPSALSVKERQVLGLQRPVSSRNFSKPSSPPSKNWEGTKQKPSDIQLPPYSPPGMPAHQAYIPTPMPTTVPESPVTSIASSNGTDQDSISAYSTPTTSPKYMPPPPPRSVQDQRSPALYSINNELSPPLAHNQFNSPRASPQPPPINTQLPPRSHSRAGSTRNLITKLAGGSNTTTGFSPVQISAPLVNHGRRFDFETDPEQREQDQQVPQGRRRRADMTPESAGSEEQWPGSY